MTPERLAEIRLLARQAIGTCETCGGSLVYISGGSKHPTFRGIVSTVVVDLLAEIDALTRDNEWRKEQMENNWPRNDYGSLLTKGEYDTLKVRLTEAKSQWGIFNERLADRTIQCDQLAADVAKLREALASIAVTYSDEGSYCTFCNVYLDRPHHADCKGRVLAETAPKEAE